MIVGSVLGNTPIPRARVEGRSVTLRGKVQAFKNARDVVDVASHKTRRWGSRALNGQPCLDLGEDDRGVSLR